MTELHLLDWSRWKQTSYLIFRDLVGLGEKQSSRWIPATWYSKVVSVVEKANYSWTPSWNSTRVIWFSLFLALEHRSLTTFFMDKKCLQIFTHFRVRLIAALKRGETKYRLAANMESFMKCNLFCSFLKNF